MIGNLALNVNEIILAKKIFLSNCSKEFVETPVNLTRKKINLTCLSLTNYLISMKLKTAFYRSHFGHCALAGKRRAFEL